MILILQIYSMWDHNIGSYSGPYSRKGAFALKLGIEAFWRPDWQHHRTILAIQGSGLPYYVSVCQ